MVLTRSTFISVNFDRVDIYRVDIDRVDIDRVDIDRVDIDRVDVDRVDIDRVYIVTSSEYFFDLRMILKRIIGWYEQAGLPSYLLDRNLFR